MVGTKTRMVLVVEDDEDIRSTMRLVLEDAGYVVAESADGESALRLLRESVEPMVVLLDMRMPGMDGTEVIGRVLGQDALASRHAYVLVTANAAEALPHRLVNQLADLQAPMLPKPFDIDQLLAVVDRAADRLV